MSFPGDAASTRRLPLVPSGDVIARLDALVDSLDREPGETLLAFDADGTLWSGDVGIDNFEALLARGDLLPAALPMLRGEASSAGLSLADDATSQARVLYDAYAHDAFPEENAFRVMACAFSGYRRDAVRAFATEVAEAAGLRARMHREVIPIIDWAVRRGIRRYVVSASHAIVVERCIELVGLAVDGVFAMTQVEEGGVLTARLREPVTYGAGKTAALRNGIGEKMLLAAFGDSAFDLHLLREARLAIAVRPKPGLRARAGECGGLVELASAP